MGKAAKKKSKKHRFDPIGRRPDAMDTEGASAPKPLSAHQARHLERKRLQAEMKGVKNASRKVSKANSKHAQKAQKKELRQNLKALKAQAAGLRNEKRGEHGGAAAASDEEEEQAAPLFQFNLPVPRAAGT